MRAEGGLAIVVYWELRLHGAVWRGTLCGRQLCDNANPMSHRVSSVRRTGHMAWFFTLDHCGWR